MPVRRTVRQIEAGHTAGEGLREEHKAGAAPGHDPIIVARRVTDRQVQGLSNRSVVRNTTAFGSSILIGRTRESNGKRASMIQFAIDMNRSAVLFDDPFRETQSKTRTANLPAA